MQKIDEDEVRREYNNDNEIWSKKDKWHYYTHKRINKFIAENEQTVISSKLIVNAGSAGENYGIEDSKTIHVDLIGSRINHKPKSLVASVENIPIENEIADLVICVGEVINYADLFRTIKEFERITKKSGRLILEFESSNTLELIFSKHFNSNAVIRKTYYRGNETRIWYYSKSWVEKTLKEFGYNIIRTEEWHYLSPLILRITNNMNLSAAFSKLDFIVKHIPFLNRVYSNSIILAEKL